ncbi:MAG: cytochrome c1 [Proteobacteria bacterium]|nr:cytochrome c1 [Pseudomonadota bacterium]
MKKILYALLVAGAALLGLANSAQAEEGYPWDHFPQEKTTDMAALQNGARLFVNYCLNCHSANYMRYNRMHDIGLTDDEIKKNLLFASEKVGDTMRIALDPKQAKEWLAAQPPDLSVIARSRTEAGKGSGADYLYTYLRTYYRDPAKPTGWNNLAFPDVAMPNPLWELQGQRTAKFVEEKDPHDPAVVERRFEGFETVSPGKLDEQQFNEQVADLVAYLEWMGEPSHAKRIQVGVWVLLFLGVLIVMTWRLNAAYWKDVK